MCTEVSCLSEARNMQAGMTRLKSPDGRESSSPVAIGIRSLIPALRLCKLNCSAYNVLQETCYRMSSGPDRICADTLLGVLVVSCGVGRVCAGL